MSGDRPIQWYQALPSALRNEAIRAVVRQRPYTLHPMLAWRSRWCDWSVLEHLRNEADVMAGRKTWEEINRDEA